MNNKYIWITIIVIVLIVILYLIYKNYNKTETTVIKSPRSVGNLNSLDSQIATRRNEVTTYYTNNNVNGNPFPQWYLDMFPNKELIRTV